MAKKKRYFVLRVLGTGRTRKTRWTCSPDEPKPLPASGIVEARKALAVARKLWPNETYRLSEGF